MGWGTADNLSQVKLTLSTIVVMKMAVLMHVHGNDVSSFINITEGFINSHYTSTVC